MVADFSGVMFLTESIFFVFKTALVLLQLKINNNTFIIINPHIIVEMVSIMYKVVGIIKLRITF
ncbi:hypothetical protein BKP44_10805 [Formosa algae]|nr:hypothetical protein AST99_03785 [Formosa algae]PNW27905.1 hypothetical protein BKP44_10805 [Formosa algae]